MPQTNRLLQEAIKPVFALGPVVPSSSTPDYVSLKNFARMAVVIQALNGTTVTGSAITLKQATSVAAGSEKPLPFTFMHQNIDCAAADLLASTAVAANTFTTDNTNSKQLMYVIDVKPEMLDSEGGFDCVRAGTGNATNSTLSVTYYLTPKFTLNAQGPAAITD